MIIDEMSRPLPQTWAGSPGVWLSLVALATLVDGLLAGASLDQSIKQLPARRRIGVRTFSRYSRASDLTPKVIAWYAMLGIGGAVLTIASALCSLRLSVPREFRQPVIVAGILAIAHSFTTARAAPINFSQRGAGDDEAALRDIFDRFERWQTPRAVLQLATFLLMLWTLSAAGMPRRLGRCAP